ncbi:predicted protein [Histoplasma capsulatum G186AR]|uniref:Uncharacterized protein n=1 Tax=Ajellomyces capsulatus (strain G186AR / H82 / ATCC MYA-2454 / RMSCC 2432) TaxID=447093 RepID=C0NDZ4_AJECG|nr:uncharacterized protein HCBG_02087 [Histoplasma capsulatum G186AR]EEH10443.1 predicted protein [Histoplasma capsulatum G186AR]
MREKLANRKQKKAILNLTKQTTLDAGDAWDAGDEADEVTCSLWSGFDIDREMEFGIGLQKAGKKMNKNGVLGDDENREQRQEIRRKNRGRWRNGRWYISSVLLYRHSQSACCWRKRRGLTWRRRRRRSLAY